MKMISVKALAAIIVSMGVHVFLIGRMLPGDSSQPQTSGSGHSQIFIGTATAWMGASESPAAPEAPVDAVEPPVSEPRPEPEIEPKKEPESEPVVEKKAVSQSVTENAILPAVQPEAAQMPPAEPAPPQEAARKDTRPEQDAHMTEAVSDAAPSAEAGAVAEEAMAGAVPEEGGEVQEVAATAGPQAVTTADTGQASEKASSPAGDGAVANYPGVVMAHLSRVRRPRASGPGSCFVSFKVKHDGVLHELDVSRSSGSKRFDREAVHVVSKASPVPPPPLGAQRNFIVEIKGR